MMERQFAVLVVDDEYWIRENMRLLIDWAAYGLRFLEPAADGESALERMAGEPVDILITDINMPYMGGLELIEQVQARYPETVIAVLSGYNDFEYVRKALVSGAMDYLLKPVAKAKMLDVLARAVDHIMEKHHEKQAQMEMRSRLEQASSVMLDRDISQLLHETKHHAHFDASVGAALLEYEQRFSSYRLILVKTASLHQLRRKSADKRPQDIVFGIKRSLEQVPIPGQKLVVHNIYHANHFLLIVQTDPVVLDACMPPLLAALCEQTGYPVQAVASQTHLALGELRKAYDETRAALLSLRCNAGNTFVYAQAQQPTELVARLAPQAQRELEVYAQTQQRGGFHQTIERVGLFRCAEDGWTVLETLHVLNTIGWVIRRQAEQNGDPEQALALENLMELLLGDAEHIDQDEIRGLLTQMEDECFAAVPSAQSDTMKETVALVSAYIDDHYAEDISLGLLSTRFAVDGSYLSKGFKQATGVNLMLYIARARILRAKELLREEGHTIAEIAQLVGYDDYAYFSRVFKKIEGVSPRRYREAGQA